MSRPRNLLVIFPDQLRRDALSCYGDENVRTPHIDALADRGVRFHHANATFPVCVPFRFSLMTGEHAHTRMVPAIEWRMSPAERTLADDLNDAGYESLYVGKWHLYGDHNHMPGFGPQRDNRRPVPRTHQGRWKHWRGCEIRNNPWDTCYFVDDDPTPIPLEGYQTDGLFDVAMNEMGRLHKEGKPFACVLSVEPPHVPDTAPEAYENRWRDRDITLPPNFAPRDEEHRQQLLTHRRLYYAMIENLDDNVGRMQRFLEQQGLADDTVVVFVSDHGEMGGSHGLRQKSLPYEESAGIPLIIADPSQPHLHGTTRDEVLCTEDLMPTLLGLMGTTPARELPGLDASPLIRDARATLDRDGVLLEFVSELRSNYGATLHHAVWRAFRTRDHLYAVRGDLTGATPWLLYDLREDPHQLHNLVEQPAHHDTAARLHVQLCDAMIRYGDDFPVQPAFGRDGQNLFP